MKRPMRRNILFQHAEGKGVNKKRERLWNAPITGVCDSKLDKENVLFLFYTL